MLSGRNPSNSLPSHNEGFQVKCCSLAGAGEREALRVRSSSAPLPALQLMLTLWSERE